MNSTLNTGNNDIHNLGGAINRFNISISNFPTDIKSGYGNIILLENYLVDVNFSDFSLHTITDFMHNRTNILPAEHNEYNFGDDNTITLTFKLDEYKRNYFMFLSWAMSLLKKDTVDEYGKVISKATSAGQYKIDSIDIDLYDNFGKLTILNSFTIYNLYLTSLTGLNFDIYETNYKFKATFKYEFFRINYDRLKTYEEIINIFSQEIR